MLSEKSIEALPQFETEWERIEMIIKDFVDVDFLQKLASIEADLNNNSLYERYKAIK